MSANSKNSLVTGRSLVIRLSHSLKAGRPYENPELTLRKYYRTAESNDGRFLYVGNPGRFTSETIDNEHIENLILLNSKTGHAVTGHIVSAGDGYNPNAESPCEGYYPIKPLWIKEHSLWAAINEVRWIDDFDQRRYMALSGGPGSLPRPLSDSVRSERYVVPINEVGDRNPLQYRRN